MKNFILFGFCFIAYSSLTAQNKIVKTNLIHTLYQDFNLGMEYVVAPKSSLEFGLTLYKLKFHIAGEYLQSRGPGLYFTYRYFLGKKEVPRGTYLASQLRFNRYSSKSSTDVKGFINRTGAGAVIGRQWIFGNESGFTLDISAGLRYSRSTHSEFAGNRSDSGLESQVNIVVGYAL